MHIRLCKYFFAMLCVTFLYCATANAVDRGLSLVSSTGLSTVTVTEGEEPFVIEVWLDDATDIAGASFTITYDTVNLFLASVESSFFQTFAEQITVDPGCVTLEKEYCSPIVDNEASDLDGPVTTGSMIAAARVDKGTGTDVPIFTLNFELKAGGSIGTYPVAIIQSKIFNVDAGYTTLGGDLIPFLVGIDDVGGYPTYDVPSPVGCSLVISAGFVDNDNGDGTGDGIDDNWEIANRPDGVAEDDPDVLTYFTADGDYERDGYSDYQEYLNFINGETEYDPTVKNDPWGTGYKPSVGFLPAVLNLLLSD